MLIISSLFFGLNNRKISWDGPIFQDRQYRIKSMQLSIATLDQAEHFREGSVILAGYYLPELEWRLDQNPVDGVVFEYLLSRDKLDQLQKQETPIYYLPGIDLFNISIYGVNPSDYGGMPMPSNYIE